MITFKANNRVNNLVFKSFLILSLFFYSMVLYGQSPVNFSGVWIQDTTKSDDFYKSFEVKYEIKQTLQTFTVKQTLSLKGSNEAVINDYTFTLDGKETTMKKEGGCRKGACPMVSR